MVIESSWRDRLGLLAAAVGISAIGVAGCWVALPGLTRAGRIAGWRGTASRAITAAGMLEVTGCVIDLMLRNR